MEDIRLLNKKFVLMAIFLVSLLAISAVSANDLNTTDEIVSDSNNLIVSDDRSVASIESANDDVLTSNAKTFSDLNQTINGNDNSDVYLNGDYAFNIGSNGVRLEDDFRDGIFIDRDVTIHGNGFTIDGMGVSRIFKVTGGDVVLRNIVFVNGNSTSRGGAINGDCSVVNCTFINNKAESGGAISSWGTVEDSTFVNNYARNYGGAIDGGDVVNCIFTGNSAGLYGGASSSAYVVNCRFIDNHAQEGGGAYCGCAEDCYFANNSADYGGATSWSESHWNCYFVNNSANVGGAIFIGYGIVNATFVNNSAFVGGAITECMDLMNCTFVNNSAKYGRAIHYCYCDVVNCTFVGEDIDSNNLIDNTGGKFEDIQKLIDGASEGDIINLSGYYIYSKSIVIDKPLTIIGLGETILDGHCSAMIEINSDKVKLVNLDFINSYSNYDSFMSNSHTYSGAILSNGDELVVENCNFVNNKGFVAGAIIVGGDNSIVRNCSFINNKVTMLFEKGSSWIETYTCVYYDSEGYRRTLYFSSNVTAGAICWTGNDGLLDACTFSDNYGYCDDCNAIGDNLRITIPIILDGPEVTKYYGGPEKYAVYLTINNNPLSDEYVNITVNGKTSTVKTDSDGKASIDLDLPVGEYNVTSVYNAFSTTSKVTVMSTITADDASGTYLNSKVEAAFLDVNGNALANAKVTFKVGDKVYTATTNSHGVATANVDLGVGNYTVTAINPANNEQKQFKLMIAKSNSAISLDSSQSNGVITLTATLTPSTVSGNVVFSVNGEDKNVTISNGKAVLTLKDWDAGNYTVTARYNGDSNLNPSASNSVSFNVVEIYPILTAKSLTKIYGNADKLIVYLRDSNGNALANVRVSVNINNRIFTIVTNNDGQAAMAINLAPGSYSAKISYPGAKDITARIIVKKATPKLTAVGKVFKQKDRYKKYNVILKTNRNVAMKNTLVFIKFGKVVYNARTNAKGIATFKLTKLTKKGNFIGTVKFAGNKYYNARAVNVKIRVV